MPQQPETAPPAPAPDGLAVEWVARTSVFARWLDAHPAPALTRLAAGFEAEIDALSRPGRSGPPAYTLKRWRDWFPADAGAQYAFLGRAAAAGLPVAAPAGWGHDGAGRRVLATAYAGAPLATPTVRHLRRCADVLLRIHATPLDALGLAGAVAGASPAHSLDGILGAFFPRLADHPDLQALCAGPLAGVGAVAPALIHGDFNQGNVLRRGGALTVIDWTDARASDPRFDLAWAWVGLWIYAGAAAAAVFRSRYLASSPAPIDEPALAAFEALAGLRWLLVRRLLLRRDHQLSPGCSSVPAIARLVDERLPHAWRGRLPELAP
jgi:Ser/Thr protein kinase RdoA (MazF antagonist)